MSKEQPCHVPFQFSQVAHQINFNPQILAKKSLKRECKITEISQNQRLVMRRNVGHWPKILQSRYPWTIHKKRQHKPVKGMELRLGQPCLCPEIPRAQIDAIIISGRLSLHLCVKLLSRSLVQDGDRIEDRVRPGKIFVLCRFCSFMDNFSH